MFGHKENIIRDKFRINVSKSYGPRSYISLAHLHLTRDERETKSMSCR